jgi:hypothetical protein
VGEWVWGVCVCVCVCVWRTWLSASVLVCVPEAPARNLGPPDRSTLAVTRR